MSVASSSDAPSGDSIRVELADWVATNWDPDRSLVEWRTLLASSGWAVPSWPKRWHGRGWPAWSDDVVAVELSRLGVVGTPIGGGMSLAAPTILTHGPDHLRERFLLSTLTGEETWCQLFSEPGAGSDLAGLSTTAVLPVVHASASGRACCEGPQRLPSGRGKKRSPAALPAVAWANRDTPSPSR